MPTRNQKRQERQLAVASFVPRWNFYFCDACLRYLITVDVAEGTTPMFLPCGGLNSVNNKVVKCAGTMTSAMYRTTKSWPVVARRDAMGEWYKPTHLELKRLPYSVREHVAKGGLLMRLPVTDHQFPEE